MRSLKHFLWRLGDFLTVVLIEAACSIGGKTQSRRLLFLPFLFFAGVSCSSSIEATGDNHYSIECTGAVGECHERAREQCPNGYLVTNRVRPVKADRGQTQYKLNIKCR